jgi:hypothetical protein
MSHARSGLLLLLVSMAAAAEPGAACSPEFPSAAQAMSAQGERRGTWLEAARPLPGVCRTLVSPAAVVAPPAILRHTAAEGGGMPQPMAAAPPVVEARAQQPARGMADRQSPDHDLKGALVAVLFGAFGLLVVARRGRRNAR